MTTTQPSETIVSTTRAGAADLRRTLSCRVHITRRGGEYGVLRPLFVMVHGIGMSHGYYDKLRRKLLEHGDILVLDLPGFGGTPKPERGITVQDYAAVVAQVLDEEGARECVVIGHSMGAQFATELAIARPDLVSQLVLIGPVTDVQHRSPVKHTLMLAADTLIEQPLTNLMVGVAYVQCGPRWYLKELPVMLGYRLDERLPLATCPALVIRGTRDIISGHDWCKRLTDTACRGELVEVPRQPHAAHRGGAAAVAAAILTAIEQHQLNERAEGPSGAHRRPDRKAEASSTTTHLIRSSRSYMPGTESASDVADLRSITVGDQQCRSYYIGQGTCADPIDRHNRTAGPVRAGSQHGGPIPVFVLIHGIGMSHRYFRRLGVLLSAVGDVHLIDLPGYGWTGRPERASSNEATADLLGKLLDEAGASNCVVVGHSMGAQSATELAVKRPDLVSHLILIGAAIDVDHRTAHQQAVRLSANSVLEKPLLSLVQFFDVLRCGPRWYLAQLKLAMTYPLEERLPLAEQPVLVLRGSRDIVAGATWSNRLARTARHGEAGTITGAPHAAHHSAAGAVASAIIRFLNPTT